MSHPNSPDIPTPTEPFHPVVTVGGKPVAVVIRPFQASDMDGVKAWQGGRRHKRATQEGYPWQNMLRDWFDQGERFDDLIRRQDGWAFTLTWEKRILGVVTVIPETDGWLEIDTLQACPDSARAKDDPLRIRGVGTTLLVAAIAEGFHQGYHCDFRAFIKPLSEPFYRTVAERYRTEDQPGLEFLAPDKVRFSPEGAITFLKCVAGRSEP